jgi:CubicO group peptidase (beta-lactamase class C family)
MDRTGQVQSAVIGEWPNGRAVTTADRFYAASLAKQVTGAALALLVREGRIDPDAGVATYLDELPAWGHRITARQLAHHVAGIPRDVIETVISGHWTDDAVMGALADVAELAPRTFVYSNVGYVLLGRLVAAASGEPFSQFIESRFALSPAPDVGLFPQTVLLGDKLPLSSGDGGLWTSAETFVRWLDRQNRDEFGVEALVTSPGPGADDYGWGLGLRQLHGNLLLIHGGGWQGASAKSARCPSLGIAVVALAACDEFDQVARLVDAVLAATEQQ